MTRTMKPSTILKRARKLIERGWCRFTVAKDASGRGVGSDSPKAIRWCALGAIDRAAGPWGISSRPWHFFEKAVDGSGVAFNNAQTNKRPVLRAFDRAIALAVKEGK